MDPDHLEDLPLIAPSATALGRRNDGSSTLSVLSARAAQTQATRCHSDSGRLAASLRLDGARFQDSTRWPPILPPCVVLLESQPPEPRDLPAAASRDLRRRRKRRNEIYAARQPFRSLTIAAVALAAVTQLFAETDPVSRRMPVEPGSVETSSIAAKSAGPIADPGFETGSPNPFWTEASTNFGTPLCTVAGCGTGGGSGPRTGDWWAWFGGSASFEEGSVSQEVTFPAGATGLSFWLEVAVCAAGAGAGHFMEVTVDGTQVFLIDAASPLCGATGYVEQTIDVTAWAGGTHTLEFHSIIDGPTNTNFFVDDLAFVAPPGDLEAVWWFDFDGSDSSGNSHHATLEGAAIISPGVISGALDLRAGVRLTILSLLRLTFSIRGALHIPLACPEAGSCSQRGR